MDRQLQGSMLRYYEDRAEGYEASFYRMTEAVAREFCPVPEAEPYHRETDTLAGIAARYARGRVADLACGTAHWLPHYGPVCEHVTLVDQSPAMLAEAREKARSAGLEDECTFVQEDILSHPLESQAFDTALVSFFMSHVVTEQEDPFFAMLRSLLKPGGRLLLFDSVWSQEHARRREKACWQQRRLPNGRTYSVYKRYLDESDVAAMGVRHGVRFQVLHAGRVFIAAVGVFGA